MSRDFRLQVKWLRQVKRLLSLLETDLPSLLRPTPDGGLRKALPEEVPETSRHPLQKVRVRHQPG